MILAFFGGLKHNETMELVLEKMNSAPDGIYVTHCRSKQRSDKKETKFLIPRSSNKDDINFAGVIDLYLNQIKYDLGIFSGKAFWTGKELAFVNLPLGKIKSVKFQSLWQNFLKKKT